MIITIGNIKGGVGKTTISTNLAIARFMANRDVLLVDGDEQGTSKSFTELRSELWGHPGYTAVSLQGASLRTQVRQLSSKYEDIIIDVGGRDTGSLRASLTVSDILLIPVQPRSFDIWALEQVSSLIEEAKEVNDNLKALAFLNAADSTGKDNEEAAKVIEEYTTLKYLPSLITRRKSFPNAAAIGKSILEMVPKDQKAVEELKALEASIF